VGGEAAWVEGGHVVEVYNLGDELRRIPVRIEASLEGPPLRIDMPSTHPRITIGISRFG
jgi:hypothetical protein